MGADLEVAHSAGLISTGIPSATVSMPSIGNRRFHKLFMAGKNETAKPSQPKNKQLARAILPSKKSEIITKGHVRNPISKPLPMRVRSEEHTSELQSRPHLVCRLLLEKKKNNENLFWQCGTCLGESHDGTLQG